MNRNRSIPTKIVLLPSIFLLCAGGVAIAQKTTHSSPSPTQAQAASVKPPEISGMYSFLREGEFVQITVEEGKLSGFISRYGDQDSDRGVFLDQFFTKAALKGDALSFTTKSVHGTWFEFAGHVRRGDVPSKEKEGYWVIRGTLKQMSEDDARQVSEKSREVVFRSFPDLDEQ